MQDADRIITVEQMRRYCPACDPDFAALGMATHSRNCRAVLTLAATVAEPGSLCSGHRDEIPGIDTEDGPYVPAYADQDGWLWCLACARHMSECEDSECGHPRARFASAAVAAGREGQS